MLLILQQPIWHTQRKVIKRHQKHINLYSILYIPCKKAKKESSIVQRQEPYSLPTPYLCSAQHKSHNKHVQGNAYCSVAITMLPAMARISFSFVNEGSSFFDNSESFLLLTCVRACALYLSVRLQMAHFTPIPHYKQECDVCFEILVNTSHSCDLYTILLYMHINLILLGTDFK